MNRSKPGEVERLYRYFLRAVRRRRPKTILRLIRRHPELHEFEGEAGTLVEVLSRDAPRLLERAFSRAGLSPNAVGRTFITPLQQAVASGDLRRVKLLLRYGANTETRNNSGETALGYAAAWGELDAVRLLLAAGADVNAVERDPVTGYRSTPLDCCGWNVEIAVLLRTHGGKTLDELVAVEGAFAPLT